MHSIASTYRSGIHDELQYTITCFSAGIQYDWISARENSRATMSPGSFHFEPQRGVIRKPRAKRSGALGQSISQCRSPNGAQPLQSQYGWEPRITIGPARVTPRWGLRHWFV